MDKFFRFSDYDVFAYLTAGFAAFAIADLATGTAIVWNGQWTVASGALTILGAYVAGQIIATPASWMERGLVFGLLGAPADILFHGSRRGLSKAFEYYRPLDARIAAPIRAAMQAGDSGKVLFGLAHANARKNPAAAVRVDSFLRLYGLCRNLSFVLFIGACVLMIASFDAETPRADTLRAYAAISVVAGAGMFFRYLKFLRLFAVEVFTAYSISLSERAA